jgi:hypothetical protein
MARRPSNERAFREKDTAREMACFSLENGS